jgi:hypothetical protein
MLVQIWLMSRVSISDRDVSAVMKSFNRSKFLLLNLRMDFQPQLCVMHGIVLGRNVARIFAEISQLIHQFREIRLNKGIEILCLHGWLFFKWKYGTDQFEKADVKTAGFPLNCLIDGSRVNEQCGRILLDAIISHTIQSKHVTFYVQQYAGESEKTRPENQSGHISLENFFSTASSEQNS